MKFRFPLAMLLAVLIFAVVAPAVSAQVADGTYQVNYEVKHASNDNASIADGYFQKPATVTVKNGVATVTVVLTSSDYVKSFSTPSGATVVSEDNANNTRTYQFQVADLSKPLTVDFVVDVEGVYENAEHQARFVFDASGLPKASATDSGADNSSNGATDDNGGEVENPKTGENSSITLYALLMLASVIGLIAIWKFRPARN